MKLPPNAHSLATLKPSIANWSSGRVAGDGPWGPGIRGNRVIGQTTVNPESGFDQSAAVIDPTTLENTRDGIHIRPEHIQQAQRELLGIAEHPLCARFKLDLPDEERLNNLFG